jgi:hypothetical protein
MALNNVTIRSYQVGFGDCFLLTFNYDKPVNGRDKRHVLIDCGSTAPPRNVKKTFTLTPVAEDIKKVTAGKLDAVVATHRHKDHISGFATAAKGKGAGDILRKLKPDLVLQPWTEDPKLPKDAKRPKSVRNLSGKYAMGMQGMHAFSASVLAEINTLKLSLSKAVTDQLGFLGDDNLSNLSAVNNLMTMGKKNEYLFYGAKTGLEALLPGVKVHVLGPPTVEQNEGITKQRSTDASEFWHMRGLTASTFGPSGTPPFSAQHRVGGTAFPPEVRWFIPRIQASRGAQLLELVRILDNQMNNTSLILLFEYNGKRLLFPGDAQIENWNHALKDAPEAKANLKLLAGTDLYKVGHHGSLNATPKTLWALFKNKGAKKKLRTMLSTRPGKHGSTTNKSEVPRRTLLGELQDQSTLFNTDTLKSGIQFQETTI